MVAGGACQVCLFVDEANDSRCLFPYRVAANQGVDDGGAGGVFKLFRASLSRGVTYRGTHAKFCGVVTVQAWGVRVLLDKEIDVRVRVRYQYRGGEYFNE